MKPTDPKRLHLLDTDDPLICWSGLIARCGYQFQRAEPLWMFRDHTLPTDDWLEAFSTVNMCGKCLKSAPESTEAKRAYVYGLVEAQPKMIDGEVA